MVTDVWSGRVHLAMDVLEGPNAFPALEAGKAALRDKAAQAGVSIRLFKLHKPPSVCGTPITFGGYPPCYTLEARGVPA